MLHFPVEHRSINRSMLHKCYMNVTFRFSHPLHRSTSQPSITQPLTPFPPFPIFTHFVLPPLQGKVNRIHLMTKNPSFYTAVLILFATFASVD